jgi:RNA polymerase sigma-32 factor
MMTSTTYTAARCNQYMNVPRLSAGAERELIVLWQEQGDARAREKLVEANMRHVVSIATRYRRYPVAYGDLLSEGSLGLVIAIDRFDPARGVRLVTYASYWIRACIFQAIIKEWKKGKTGLGMTRSKTFFKIRRLLASQMARYGERGPNLEEMAADLEVSVDGLQKMLDHIDMHDMSLDADHDGDRPSGLHERFADAGPCPETLASRLEGRNRARLVIERALACLDDRERLVASARLMEPEPRTLADLGKRMGVSRERARQIEVRAREKLGRALRREGLSPSSVNAFFA